MVTRITPLILKEHWHDYLNWAVLRVSIGVVWLHVVPLRGVNDEADVVLMR